MCVNKLGHLVTSFFSDSLTDVVAVARGVYGRYLRGGYGARGGEERSGDGVNQERRVYVT